MYHAFVPSVPFFPFVRQMFCISGSDTQSVYTVLRPPSFYPSSRLLPSLPPSLGTDCIDPSNVASGSNRFLSMLLLPGQWSARVRSRIKILSLPIDGILICHLEL